MSRFNGYWCVLGLAVALVGCGESAPVDPRTNPNDGPPIGNGDGTCSVPAEAQEEDVSSSDTVVGDGAPETCTSNAFVDAVARGGVITFDCGPDPVVITLDRTAKVFNDQKPDIVIDGGGKVTLSGAGRVRILYQNTCDSDQVWTTDHCNDQDHPRLTVQNLTFRPRRALQSDQLAVPQQCLPRRGPRRRWGGDSGFRSA
jgi:hypothetical protein